MTAIAKPPPIVLGLLAVGALWWMSQQRRAMASPNRTPVYGTNAAITNPSSQRYLVGPSGYLPTQTPLQSGLSFLQGLIGTITGRQGGAAGSVQPPKDIVNAYGFGGPSSGIYGLPQPIARPDGYEPLAVYDNAGENAARAYALSNPDEFISNPPPNVAYVAGSLGSTNGWLDNQ